jgi:hypothetical protein
MNQPIPPLNLPDFPLQKDDFTSWRMNLMRELDAWTSQVERVMNTGAIQGLGAPIASATAISPTHCIHHVTGTAAIEDINVPYVRGQVSVADTSLRKAPMHTGPLYLIKDAAWTLVDSATAGTGTANIATVPTSYPVGNVVALIFDGLLWYPVT